MRWACRTDRLVRLLVAPGDHVLAGEPVATVRAIGAGQGSDDADEVADAILRKLTLGGGRTPAQDIRFALQQLVEMAVRALSPGTNDPYTAKNVTAELAAPLRRIVATAVPPLGRVDADGTLRLVLHHPRGTELVDAVFDDLRTHGVGDGSVVAATVALAGRIAPAATPQLRARLREHADLMVQAWERADVPEFDRRRMQRHLAEAFYGVSTT